MALTQIQGSGISNVTISADGEVTKAAQPAFQVTKSSSQDNIAVGGASEATIVFDSERFDVGNNFASNTFTAPVTGKYSLVLLLRLTNLDSAASFYYMGIVTSNEAYYNIWTSSSFSADLAYQTMHIVAVADMDANDTAFTNIYQSGGSSQTDIPASESFFSGYLLG